MVNSVNIDKIIAFEQGELDDKETIHLFAELIRDGSAFKLQGCYGRTAQGFITNGVIDNKGNVLREHF